MQTLLFEIFGPLAVAFFLFVIVASMRRWARKRENPEELQAARDEFRRRLVHPRPAEVEEKMGALLPERLLRLYEDHQTILTEQLEIRRPNAEPKEASEWLEAFLPLDAESQEFAIDLVRDGWGKGFCFATDGAGNFYWVPAHETRRPDSPVFFASRDPRANEEVASSLDEFLSWPRTLHAAETQVSS